VVGNSNCIFLQTAERQKTSIVDDGIQVVFAACADAPVDWRTPAWFHSEYRASDE
jgi:hypothetical protein